MKLDCDRVKKLHHLVYLGLFGGIGGEGELVRENAFSLARRNHILNCSYIGEGVRCPNNSKI